MINFCSLKATEEENRYFLNSLWELTFPKLYKNLYNYLPSGLSLGANINM